ncbi:MAG: LysM repeat protein [Saprospiraceae bacterium]|jgi:LysM repeat protein
MKRTALTAFFICLYFLSSATITNDSIKVTGDSIHYLTLKDTILLSIGDYQEMKSYHYIAPKQTLYSLSRFYGLSLEELLYYNPDLDSKTLSPGQVINIPIPTKSIIRYKIKDFDEKKHIPICYVIKKGDTMYNISKRIFQMPIDTVMARNHLTSFTLSLGQVLQLGWMSIDGIPEAHRKFKGHPIWKKSEVLRQQYIQERAVKREREERGVAFWQKQSNKDSDLYALHRYAPINSVVAVTNLMKKRTVYVKVIGRIPESVYGDNVVVIVSSTIANMLGAKDTKFYVEVKYGK